MCDLIRSHLTRLWKSPVFLLALAVMVPYGLGLSNSAVGDIQSGATGPGPWGQTLFGPGLLMGIILAVVFSLFFGAEYADGTIRNKLVAGHGRAGIYLAALAASLLAALALYLVSLLAGAPRLGWMLKNCPAPETKTLALCLGGTALLLAGYCSVCVTLCMLIQRRSLLAVVLLLLMAGLFFASMQVQDAWETAANGGMQMTVNAAGEQEFIFHEPGQAGPLTAFLYDALPGCQAYRYMDMDAAPRMLACSAVLALASTALGLVLFRRKDIR